MSPAIVIVVVVSAMEPATEFAAILQLATNATTMPTETVAVYKAVVQLATDATITPIEVAIVLGEESAAAVEFVKSAF